MIKNFTTHKDNNYLLFWASFIFFLIIKYFIITYHINIEDILYSDQTKYWRLSNLLLSEKYFDEDYGFLRMPLYPLFLFFVRSIADQIMIIILVQTIIGFFNIYLIYKIALLFNKNISYLVICLSLLSVNLINTSTFILTEAIFFTFYLYFLYYFIKCVLRENIKFKDNLKNIILSAVFLALATLTKPISIYFMVVLPLVFLKKEIFSKKIFSIILFVLIYSLVVSPWNFRNLNYFGVYKLSSSIADNLNGYYLPYIVANDSKISLIDAKNIINNDENLQKLDSKDEENKKKYFFKKIKEVKITSILESWIEGGLKYILAPAMIETYYNLNIEKTSFSNIQSISFIKQVGIFIFKNENKIFGYIVIISIFLGLITKLLMCNYLIKTYKKNIFLNTLLFTLLFLNLAIVGPLGSARYRLVLEPFFIIYTALSINYFFTKFKLFNSY
jgi:hypothetical protein